MNELAATQELDWCGYEKHDYYDEDDEGHVQILNNDDDDIIATYLEKKVEDLVKQYLAEKSDVLIDLSIKAYILSESNRKREEKYNLVHKKGDLNKKRY